MVNGISKKPTPSTAFNIALHLRLLLLATVYVRTSTHARAYHLVEGRKNGRTPHNYLFKYESANGTSLSSQADRLFALIQQCFRSGRFFHWGT